MIKCDDNKGVFEITTTEGVPGILTELTSILRSVRKAIYTTDQLPLKAVDELIDHAVRLSRATTEELRAEANVCEAKMMQMFGGGRTIALAA